MWSPFSLFGMSSGSFIPPFPEISIGDNFYPQVTAVVNSIDIMIREFSDLRKPLEESLNRIILPSIKQNFDVGGRPAWKPLADYTVEIRGSSQPILIRSGDLQSAASSRANFNVTEDEIYVTDNMPSYAKYHQNGTSKMPARVFMGYQDEDIAAIEQIFYDWIDQVMARGGFR